MERYPYAREEEEPEGEMSEEEAGEMSEEGEEVGHEGEQGEEGEEAGQEGEEGERSEEEAGEPEGGPGGAVRPLEGTKLRAAQALCQGEDSATSRFALRRLAVEAGHERARVAGMGRDELCRLLGIDATGFRGESAFGPAFPLSAAPWAMRTMAEFAAGGTAAIVRDGPDPAAGEVEVLEVQLPTAVEDSGPERVPSVRRVPLPPLPPGFRLAEGVPAQYFSQPSDVAPGPVVLRVVQSEDDRLAAACFAGTDARPVPSYLPLYDPREDPETRRGAMRGERGLVCVFAALVGMPGEPPEAATRVCVVHYMRGHESRFTVAATRPSGEQSLWHGLGDHLRVGWSADPEHPERACLVVSARNGPEGDLAEAYLHVDTVLVHPERGLETDSGLSGDMPRLGQTPMGHHWKDVALLARPDRRASATDSALEAARARMVSLRVTSTVRPTGGAAKGVQDYPRPADPEADLYVDGGLPRSFRLAGLDLQAPLRLPRVALPHQVAHRSGSIMYGSLTTQEVNPLAGDLLLLSADDEEILDAFNVVPPRLFLTSGRGAMAELPAPQAQGFVHGAVAATADKDPRQVSYERDAYTVALSAADGSGYRVAVAVRMPGGGVSLRGYREFAAPPLGPRASRFFGLLAAHGTHVAEHAEASAQTRLGMGMFRRDPYAAAEGAAGAGAGSAAEGAAGAGPGSAAEGRGSEPASRRRPREAMSQEEGEKEVDADEALAAALRRRLNIQQSPAAMRRR